MLSGKKLSVSLKAPEPTRFEAGPGVEMRLTPWPERKEAWVNRQCSLTGGKEAEGPYLGLQTMQRG
jgi:hypothetical protein